MNASTAPDFLISIINQFWKPGLKLLEVGCGPAYLRQIYKSDYIGTDITLENYTPNVPRVVDIVCPAEQLQLANNSVDLVLIKSALYLFNDITAALKEAKRVLKPNGKICVFDYNKRTQKILAKKEGHNRYPCWTQWGLKKRIVQQGFREAKLFLPTEQKYPLFLKWLHLVRQELKGTWAIVVATK